MELYTKPNTLGAGCSTNTTNNNSMHTHNHMCHFYMDEQFMVCVLRTTTQKPCTASVNCCPMNSAADSAISTKYTMHTSL